MIVLLKELLLISVRPLVLVPHLMSVMRSPLMSTFPLFPLDSPFRSPSKSPWNPLGPTRIFYIKPSKPSWGPTNVPPEVTSWVPLGIPLASWLSMERQSLPPESPICCLSLDLTEENYSLGPDSSHAPDQVSLSLAGEAHPPLELIVASAKYRKLLCLQRVSLVKSFVSVI